VADRSSEVIYISSVPCQNKFSFLEESKVLILNRPVQCLCLAITKKINNRYIIIDFNILQIIYE
jgi:hypothetical protein